MPVSPLPCPCGSDSSYNDCCAPLHQQVRQAATPEELMRSRYSAYALGDLDHVFRTWHPRTRPEDLAPDPTLAWKGLEVLGSGEQDGIGYVTFRAHFLGPDGPGVLEERSRFEYRRDRWVYLDGEVSR